MATAVVQQMQSGSECSKCSKCHNFHDRSSRTAYAAASRLGNEPDTSKFDGLVQALKQALGPSSGLTSDDVNVSDLQSLMAQYDAADEGWMPYNFGDASQGYTRNLVDEGNGKSNLLVLVWSPGKGSAIHDHGNAHCVMKILRGNLTETRYAFPHGDKEAPMEITSEKTYTENAVTYMSDDLGVHRVWNKGSDFAVSLHLYTPPNVARSGCNIFNEKTSKSLHVSKCPNYTAYGKKLRHD